MYYINIPYVIFVFKVIYKSKAYFIISQYFYFFDN